MTQKEMLLMPANSVALTESEMRDIEGGGIKEKVIEFAVNYVIGKAVDYVWKNRKKIWQMFLDGLAPTDATKATPYYKTFCNAIKS